MFSDVNVLRIQCLYMPMFLVTMPTEVQCSY